MTVVADITAEHPDRITLTGISPLQKDQVLQVPGSRWDGKRSEWHAPIGWATSLAIKAVFARDFEVGPGLASWVERESRERIQPAMALREAMDAEGDPRLYPYQRAGVAFMKVSGQALCADEMGTGKTRQALTTLLEHYRDGVNPFPALVVVPNSTKISWAREAEIVWPGLSVYVIDGSMTQRKKQLQEALGSGPCPKHQPGDAEPARDDVAALDEPPEPDPGLTKAGKPRKARKPRKPKAPPEPKCTCAKAHVVVMNWEAVRSHSRLAPYGNIAFTRCVECGGEDESVSEARCHSHVKELNRARFGAVIVDEAHRMKDARSQQTRAIKAAAGDAPIRLALTGTPIASAPDDLWSILNFLSPAEWPSRTKFVDRMLEVSYNAFGASHVIGIKSHMQEEFFAALDPRMRRMPKELVLKQLPPVVPQRRDVEMSPKQAKAYKQMKEQMIAELDNGDLLITTSPLTRVTRMLQFASSYAELSQVEKTTIGEDGMPHTKTVTQVDLAEPSCKVDAFMADLPDYEGDQIVVFAVSRKLIELLSAKLERAKIPHGLITGAISNDERQFHMDQFQAGKTKMILCTTGAGGTGITLTAARIGVFLQRPWSMIESQQAEARLHRIGSERHSSILIVDYATRGTIEETVMQALEAKGNRLEEILRDKDLLRRAIEAEVTEDGGDA